MKVDLQQQLPAPFVSTTALAVAEIQHTNSRLPWLWSSELTWDTQRLKCKQSSGVVADKSINSKPAPQVCEGGTIYLVFPLAWPAWQYFPVDFPVITDFSTRQNNFQNMQTWAGKKNPVKVNFHIDLKNRKEIKAIHLSRRGHLIFNYTEYSIIPAQLFHWLITLLKVFVFLLA